MKFVSLTDGVLDGLEIEFASALHGGKVRGGARCLFYARLTATDYLPYGMIVHAFMRQEEVSARLCCGTGRFDQIYLVTVDALGIERQSTVETVAICEAFLALIAEKNPDVEIGYYQKENMECGTSEQ